ncbi:hypothetical protein [Gimesia aquarii]|uniref:Uncharacterized protein n=1 Tax=Gimesia aquarii TaxID=2527964 RepID=A0A517WW05_9PLAN|nr:hypothetical protein [Gimesia aquarii]QDU09392.1 hypothetical protein V202x_27670 [Gimesia aquarii]
MPAKQGDDTSTFKVIAMLMVAIALFGWAFAAAAYSHSEEGWRQAESSEADPDGLSSDERFKDAGNIRRESKSSLRDFIWNAIRQIPNVFSVIAFNFQHRLWLVILFACLEGGALFLGYVMSKID